MMHTRTRYFAGELARNLKRQPLLVLTTIGTVAVSLVLLGFFATIWAGADRLLSHFATEIHLTVYLGHDINEATLDAVVGKIKARPEVQDLSARSAHEDRERNRTLLPRDLAASLPADAVPGDPSIDVVLIPGARTRAGVAEISAFARSLDRVEGVASVLHGSEKVQLAFAVVDSIRVFGLAVSLLLLGAAIFFVFSTIRLSVHARKEEVEIRRLMGATRTFIRVPFYLEGAVEGGLGAVAAVAIIWLLLERFNAYLRYTQLLRYQVDFLSGPLVGAFVAGGIVLGLLGSAFALGRYLKQH